MRQPKPKLVEVQVKIDKAVVACYDGSLHSTPTGNLFVGVSSTNQAAPIAKISFPGWNLRSAGQPSRTASKNMTLILKNHIVMDKYDVSWSLAPGYWQHPISDRSIFRAKAAAKRYIRSVVTASLDDRHVYAIAFMHDNKERDKSEMTGPAWVLRDDWDKAKFIADVQIRKNDKELTVIT